MPSVAPAPMRPMPSPAPMAARPAPIPAPCIAHAPAYSFALYVAACNRGRIVITVLQPTNVILHRSAPIAGAALLRTPTRQRAPGLNGHHQALAWLRLQRGWSTSTPALLDA